MEGEIDWLSLRGLSGNNSEKHTIQTLTPNERRILVLLEKGFRVKEVATQVSRTKRIVDKDNTYYTKI
ncbi:MAG: hypothetical protein O2904_04120 [bacterium]|nr:hypothetical protein [bacterium]